MVVIRPAWSQDEALAEFAEPQISRLLQLERSASDATTVCLDVARSFLDPSQVDGVKFLETGARNDLIAGCELARTGYLKQAYTLWRTWYEQSIFALYFLEAPLHRLAWKVSPTIGPDDKPDYRLMLHQLLSDSGDSHPFSLVYTDRYLNLLQALKVSAPAKKNQPIPKAKRILTMLSQGVHGTYQPPRPKSLNESCEMLEKHCLPAISAALESVTVFWLLFLLSQIDDIPPDLLIDFRERSVTAEELAARGLEDSDKIALIGPLFKQVFAAIK